MTRTGSGRHGHSLCPRCRPHPRIQISPLEALSPTLLKTRNQLYALSYLRQFLIGGSSSVTAGVSTTAAIVKLVQQGVEATIDKTSHKLVIADLADCDLILVT